MDPTEELARWECAGGHWQVVARDADSVTVALLTCDGGEEMSRMTAPAVALEGFLAGRTGSAGE